MNMRTLASKLQAAGFDLAYPNGHLADTMAIETIHLLIDGTHHVHLLNEIWC